MTNPNHNWDENRLAEMLRAAQYPALPPDEEFLARLRAESTKAFQSSANETTPSVRKSKMFIVVWRALAATVAAVVLAATWFMASDSGGSAVTLAKILEKTASAESLHLRIQRAEQPGEKRASPATEAWSAQAEKLRVNHADGTYEIARRDKLWQIDEKANRATSSESPYYCAERKSLDLLPLFGLDGSKARKDLLAAAARPTREHIGDQQYDVYHYQTIENGLPLMIEARIDRATQLLDSLETLVDRDGKQTPAVTLTVLGANQPVDENLFVVGDTLTEDGRIGKVSDVQGLVSVRPVMAERWTPVCGNILLRPGDWLRTDLRGANAVAARLAGKTQVVAGPGTLVELIAPKKVRLYEGEIQVTVQSAAPLELLGPGEQKIEVKTSGVYRVENDRLVLAKQDPKWLKGFQGAEVQESIGSLVANVDGRNVPLTVGYHKVSVEVRDQIARTTVEESFANLTGARLEGVFYFPLPQDASISGFGMWIGNELVEADIVEKQRAREIYETILRERRDPGLLEWSGGNLFKARVFPIEAHAEKRIRIVYTQVLPLRGNSFRYNYALHSEMLKQHPLRELSIDVKISSVVPLKKVASPTHTVRTAQTAQRGARRVCRAGIRATRDFEVLAELEGKQAELTLIPHRRGDDGYFMLLLAPPANDAGDDRDLLTDKEPLDLILLADTSASLDAGQRRSRRSSSPRCYNRSHLATRSTWLAATWNVIGPSKEQSPRTRRTSRRSGRFSTAARRWAGATWPRPFRRHSSAGRNTCIVYVGDGIPTVGDADPAAAAAQLRRLYEEKCLDKKPVCHAVSVGSTFESGVLKAIGGLGGGSVRQISGEQGPRPVALDLLKEITRPAMRDLKVQFSGLRMARVYPEQLPNLPAGAQQILLGRYLPQGVVGAGVPPAESAAETAAPQSGKVIVTGRQGDREVRFEKAVSLADAEHGNSFIPRLWARMHLDYLLQQGATPAIKDDIIALSEDYHIVTPYTSLLILESDADRERFKVKRGFAMRDGEKFFAAGRDNANFELTRQQMRRAGGWRLGLRMSVLQQFAGLGRDSGAFQPRVAPTNMFFLLNKNEMGGIGGGSRDRSLSLDGENSYTGGTSVVAGTLNLSYDSSWSADVNGAIDSLGNFADKERFVGAGDDESLAERDSRESRGFVVQDQATAVSLPVSGKNKALLLPAAAALPMSELRIGGGLIGFAARSEAHWQPSYPGFIHREPTHLFLG